MKHQITKYDEFADKLDLSDKNILLENLKKLSLYSDKYKSVFQELLEMSEQCINIQPELDKDTFKNELSRLYGVEKYFNLPGCYNRVCTEYSIEKQEYTDFDEMYNTLYKVYTEHYETFIELIVEVINNPRKWMIPVKFKQEEVKCTEFDVNNIPELPKLPELPKC
jgi:hypothetical protein